jgi:Tol biopolymer transport system component
MTTYTWDYGSAAAGLQFTVQYDDSNQEFTVTSLVGSFDLNALWFSDGNTTSDGYRLAKSQNSLNMNGTDTVWDDGTSTQQKIVWDTFGALSNPDHLISAGETRSFSLSELGLTTFDPTHYDLLGVRATSVDGTIGYKWVDLAPVVQQSGCVTEFTHITNTPGDEELNGISGNGCQYTWSAPSATDKDVFWKDLDTGQSKTITEPGDQTDAHISGDGHLVVFTSDLSGNSTVELWDTSTDTVTAAPISGLDAFLSDISEDGKFVVYTDISFAGSRIAEWDVANNTTSFVGTSAQALNPSVSGNGSVVAYQDNSDAATLHTQIAITEVGGATQLINTGADHTDRNPSISADGNSVVFESANLSLTQEDVYLFDRTTQSLTDVSAAVGLGGQSSRAPDISGDGRYVVFSAVVSGEQDIYVWDRTTGQSDHISEPFIQRNAQISTDGTTISFESQDSTGQFDLVAMPNPVYHPDVLTA